MTVTFREFRPDSADAGSIVRIRSLTTPYIVTTAEAISEGMANDNPAARNHVLLAEDDASGEVVGVVHCGVAYESAEPGHGFGSPQVHPGHRGRGIGSALLRSAEEYLAAQGVTTLHAWASDETAAAFARGRGYTSAHAMHYQRLDLAAGTLPQAPALPPGFVLRGADCLGDDPRALFEADAEVTLDEPGSTQAVLDDYDDWLNSTWNDSLHNRGLSTVVFAEDGRVAAFTLAHTDGRTRYVSGMTGVRKEFRGLGLAKAAKADSLSRSRAAGFLEAFTSNDDINRPMLAVNAWFGYERCATAVEYTRALG
ncbi:GNAT family N-acetyltransferase [Streptomyces sp. NPDC004111]|uniref:GNAT family N-acetyltransferase n=1 Tax=Streptomyces sp. NPDC004111 TaxID=3364690 RepID=UPI0036CDB5D4